MILRRHSFVAFIVIAAVISVFFSPLMTAGDVNGRHLVRASLAVAVSLASVPPVLTSSSLAVGAPQARAIHSEILLALNCARLC